jgi:opacity protein-like surface antigen
MFRFAATLFAIVFSASGALAADQLAPFPYYPAPVPAPQIAPAPPPQAFDWNRFYGGVHVGSKTVDNRIDVTGTDFYRAESNKKTTDTLTGPIGGFQLGCNAILKQGFLIGLEIEGAYGKNYLSPEYGHGETLPADPAGIKRNPNLGDKLPIQIRELKPS